MSVVAINVELYHLTAAVHMQFLLNPAFTGGVVVMVILSVTT
jgi:hypothetical protein